VLTLVSSSLAVTQTPTKAVKTMDTGLVHLEVPALLPSFAGIKLYYLMTVGKVR